jgi:predicted DNA-binding transcriptional regulator YafY
MAKVRDFVGDYESIRTILRDIFLFGCFTTDDFERNGISPSKYNQEKRKLLAFIDNKYFQNQRINGKLAMHFTTDMFDTAYNFLFDTFMMKSFVESDVRLALKILQTLSNCDSELTAENVTEELELADDNIEALTVYRTLVELNNLGFISVKKDKRPYSYELEEDILSELSDDELIRLIQAVDLLRNVIYPSVCGNFLFDTLHRYVKANRNYVGYTNPFLIKHCHYAQVLDDEIMCDLLEALNNSSLVRFDYQGNKCEDIFPVRLIVDEYYGRRYLFAVSFTSNMPKLFRLDKMSNLVIGNKMSKDMAELSEMYHKQLDNSFTGACLRRDETLYTVELRVKKDVIPYIGNIQNAVITPIDEEYCSLELTLNDPGEIKPWLRRFTGSIFVQKSDEHKLAEEMENELEEWRALYEDIQ